MQFTKRNFLYLNSKGQNALLESPTGTGKTLCLLCSTLAWREAFVARQQLIHLQQNNSHPRASQTLNALNEIVSFKEKGWDLIIDSIDACDTPPQIYYASRTHSQLIQAVRELRNTPYRPNVCTLGSRTQMCIHPEVMNLPGSVQTGMCRSKVVKKACSFHAGREGILYRIWWEAAKTSLKDGQILDIEELVALGKRTSACPFYMSRELQQKADIIFLPYNYLIDPQARKAQNIDLNNAIIIVDEAHNLESVCTESSSFELDMSTLSHSLNELDACMDILSKSPSNLISTKDLLDLKNTLSKWIQEIASMQFKDKKELSVPGDYIFEFFKRIGLNFENASESIRLIETIQDVISQGNPFLTLIQRSTKAS